MAKNLQDLVLHPLGVGLVDQHYSHTHKVLTVVFLFHRNWS